MNEILKLKDKSFVLLIRTVVNIQNRLAELFIYNY